MNYEIVELEEFSGNAAKVYSIIPQGENETLFDTFVTENITTFREELKDLSKRLKQIGHTTGARESFFKKEGNRAFVKKYGDCICALYDEDGKKLRLYCLRFGNVAIILGGGGPKDKSIKKWQDDEKLTEEVTKMMDYATCIIQQINDGDLYWSEDRGELEGDLKNYYDE